MRPHQQSQIWQPSWEFEMGNQNRKWSKQIKKKNNDIRELSPTLRNKSVSNGALIDNTAEIIEKLKKDRDDYLESLKKFKTEFRK